MATMSQKHQMKLKCVVRRVILIALAKLASSICTLKVTVTREVVIQPIGGLVPCNLNANINASFIWNVNFHEKVYLFLTNFGEKYKFWTFSEKSDQSPSTDFYAKISILKKSKILRWISKSDKNSSKVSDHPPYWKNKLLLNEYFGNFRQFLDNVFFYFYGKWLFQNPTHPTKVWKIPYFFYFWRLP